LDFIKKLGIATSSDIARLQKQIDDINGKWRNQLNDLKVHHAKLAVSFANYKNKTEEELSRFIADINQIITAMEFLLNTAHAESHVSEIRNMITALKAKRTKARNAIGAISGSCRGDGRNLKAA
jgi:ribosome-binding ATPase YchF (GTP1/OBG family)